MLSLYFPCIVYFLFLSTQLHNLNFYSVYPEKGNILKFYYMHVCMSIQALSGTDVKKKQQLKPESS
jgi:hypothetical protein